MKHFDEVFRSVAAKLRSRSGALVQPAIISYVFFVFDFVLQELSFSKYCYEMEVQ